MDGLSGAPFDAVLFDLDGTLIDTVDDLCAAMDVVASHLGCRSLSRQEMHACIGSGVRAMVAQALHIATGREPAAPALDAAMALFHVAYARCNGSHSRMYPGATWALVRLRAIGLRVALVSNKPTRFIAPLLLRYGIRDAFDAVVGGDTLAQMKPEPEPLLHACAALDVAPGRALMVGDSLIDVIAARAAGCAIACVTHGYGSAADLGQLDVPLLDGLEGLPDLLASDLPFPPRTTSQHPWA